MVRWVGLGTVLLVGQVALAQATPEHFGKVEDLTWSAWDAAAAPQPLWNVRFEADVWYAALAGEVQLPGSPPAAGKTDLADLNLDSPRLSPAGQVSLRRGAWRFSFVGSSIGIENDSTMTAAGQIGGTPYGVGDVLHSDLRLTTLEATGGYRLFEARRGQWGPDSSLLVFGVDVYAGVQAQQFELDVAGPAGTSTADEWFAEPIIGADVNIDLWKQLSVDLKIDGGAAGGYDDKSVGTGAIEVGVEWRPWDNVGVKMGYRLEAMGLTQGSGDDELNFRGSSAGLIWGLDLRF